MSSRKWIAFECNPPHRLFSLSELQNCLDLTIALVYSISSNLIEWVLATLSFIVGRGVLFFHFSSIDENLWHYWHNLPDLVSSWGFFFCPFMRNVWNTTHCQGVNKKSPISVLSVALAKLQTRPSKSSLTFFLFFHLQLWWRF